VPGVEEPPPAPPEYRRGARSRTTFLETALGNLVFRTGRETRRNLRAHLTPVCIDLSRPGRSSQRRSAILCSPMSSPSSTVGRARHRPISHDRGMWYTEQFRIQLEPRNIRHARSIQDLSWPKGSHGPFTDGNSTGHEVAVQKARTSPGRRDGQGVPSCARRSGVERLSKDILERARAKISRGPYALRQVGRAGHGTRRVPWLQLPDKDQSTSGPVSHLHRARVHEEQVPKTAGRVTRSVTCKWHDPTSTSPTERGSAVGIERSGSRCWDEFVATEATAAALAARFLG